jgi:release factor glutamine methyltransferase
MTIKEFITSATNQLKDDGIQTARLDVELIVCHVLQISRTDLIIKSGESLSEGNKNKMGELVKRRVSGEPIAHFTGEKEFYSLNFTVSNKVLVPRPETEIIVDAALGIISEEPVKIVDFGSGSGCIGTTILRLRKNTTLVAIDVSEEALKITKENAQRLGVTDRCQFINEDIHKINPKDEAFSGVNLVVANPPYIDANDPLLDTKTLRFEPSIALYSKDDGFRDPIGWAEKSAKILQPGGNLLMEIGAGQSEKLVGIFKQWFKKISLLEDLAGIPRVIWAEK